ncbi:MAG: Asp-tRNA(Asn)/Glu-tRNA(Gln) amidotransferase subunit GatA [Patescibacteria group bacterium]|nr:Asp-tRNA(Asn)/Glu-tRNA(Gln) amidotransferase subunit GatA [Patescibacteria group bacterium]
MVDLNYLSIDAAHDMLVSGKVTAEDLVKFHLDKIKKLNPKVRAVITIDEKSAIDKAKAVDTKISEGKQIGVLEGIPYTAKEMFMAKGTKTTAASKILEDFIAPYSATAIRRLDEAGAILIAKVDQDEFAHGGSTENSAYHPTHNPWDLDRVPGGSSGGSAAAVAADMGIFSLGTDTGGSIRQPAAFCGVTGFKPSYGAVSRYGVISMASSFDCIGPISRSAKDTEIVFDAISGLDPRDSTSVDYKFDKPKEQLKAIYYEVGNEVDSLINNQNFNHLEVASTKPIKELGVTEESLAAYYILVPSEISSNLERYDGVRYGARTQNSSNLNETYTKTRGEFFGPEVKRRNLLGAYTLSAGYYDAYYKKAMQLRTMIKNRVNEVLDEYDVILVPTTIEPAFKIGSKADPVEMYKTDVLTVFANLAGVPSISIPFGFDESNGLPLGLQIIGKQGDDKKILEIAKTIQDATDYHKKVGEIKL